MGYTGLNLPFEYIFKVVQSGLFESPLIAAFQTGCVRCI